MSGDRTKFKVIEYLNISSGVWTLEETIKTKCGESCDNDRTCHIPMVEVTNGDKPISKF